MIRYLFIGILLISSLKGASQKLVLKPELNHVNRPITIQHGAIKATFVDNMAFGPVHKEGYNGIAELYHLGQDSSVFVPFYAGFNLEHIFGGDSLPELMEPRKNPMELYIAGENEVLLYQPPTLLSNVESITSFTLIPPHYIDITFRMVARSGDFFKHGYAGLFWASYIHSPRDKKIYFFGFEKKGHDKMWLSAFSEKHGVKSSHLHKNEKHDLYFAPNFNVVLANHFSDLRFDKPYYFGRFHNMVFAYLFESDEVIRFSQSPNGGGPTNPAWDFQYIIPDFEPGKEYSFKVRMIYKPFVSETDIANEYRIWKRILKEEKGK